MYDIEIIGFRDIIEVIELLGFGVLLDINDKKKDRIDYLKEISK